ncbi:MAG TPA: hypothetical protein VJM46_00590 [Candidatus Saccharimonadales bacterium]|nr:hypothetical protein [Candidatus Saccharimonadales bacterium]
MALDRNDPAGELSRRVQKFLASQMTHAELVVLRDDLKDALSRVRDVLNGEQLQLFTESLTIIDRLLNR